MAFKALVFVALCALASAQESHFFPYGVNVGDASLHRNDDGYSSAITLTQPFPFFGSVHTSLFVCTNGIVSFGSGQSSYTPTPFPAAARPVIAPFWADVDIRSSGAVYYREVTSGDLLVLLNDVVVDHFSIRNQMHAGFSATWAFIVTWDSVPAYPGSGSAYNTFQAVLITDGINSYVIYNYGQIMWTYGSASNGIPAQVGFDAGDHTNYFAVPASRTAEILNIGQDTNVHLVGRWMFRVDEAEIVDGGEEPVCNEDGGCDPHQVEDGDDCRDIAPALVSCAATLNGPTITNPFSNEFEFDCSFTFTPADNVALESHVFDVEFLFNRRASTHPDGRILHRVDGSRSVDGQISVALDPTEIHGAYHMGKWLSCSVTSFFSDTPDQRSDEIISSGYWIGVKAMVENEEGEFENLVRIEIDESDDSPFEAYLVPTVPIQGIATQFHHAFPIRAESTLLVRQDFGFNCTYDFERSSWGVEQDDHEHPLEVRTVTTAVSEPLMIEFIHFRPGDGHFSYWEDYAPASIPVYRYNRADRRPEYCIASSDPRMRTLDGMPYSLNAPGQFVMLESSSSRNFQVHVRTYGCGRNGACVCAVAILEGDTIYEVRRCIPSLAPAEYIIFPEGDPRNEDLNVTHAWDVHKDYSGKDYTITTPAGAQVRLNWNGRGRGYNVFINALGADFGRTKGLCGTFNGDRSDDMAYYEDRFSSDFDHTSDPIIADPSDPEEIDDFVSNWAIPRYMSLFETYPPTIEEAGVTDDRSNYCACPDDQGDIAPDSELCVRPPPQGLPPPPGIGAISSVQIIGSSTSANALNLGSPSLSLPTFGSFGRRRRRNVDDDQFDFGEGASNINYNTFPTPSGITEEDAIQYCTTELSGNDCGGHVHANVTQAIINACVLDVRDLDSLEDVSASFIGQTNYECLAAVVWSVNVTGENLTMAEIIEQVDEVIGPIVSSLCVGDCSGHGSCADSTCTCHEGWVGADCSIDENAPTDVSGFFGGDVCDHDTSIYYCSHVTVNVENVFYSEDLACKVEYDGDEYIMDALLVNDVQVRCDLPDLIIGTTNLMDLSVSVTRDGATYGTSAIYRIYDSTCLTCLDAETDCTIQTDMCSVGGRCYQNTERNTEALCYQCIPDTTQDTFTFEEGCISSEVGVGEWGLWDDYQGCSVACDYGWNYRYRSCLVPDTCLVGPSSDRMLCRNFQCNRISAEINNGGLFTFSGSTETVIGQIVDMTESIASLAATDLNAYGWQNPEDICNLVGVTPGASMQMDMFSIGHIRIAAGSLSPDTTEDSTSLRLVAEIESASVRSACGEEITRRDATTFYIPAWIIEEAMAESFTDFEALSLELIRIGEVEVEESSEEESKEKKEKEHKSSASLIGIAVGCVLAAIVVTVVVALIVRHQSKKNTPVTPITPRVVTHEEVPMGYKTKVINVKDCSAAPPSYDDFEGLSVGPRQQPPTHDTRGHKFW